MARRFSLAAAASAAVLAATLGAAAPLAAAPATYVVDQTHVGVSFRASHVDFSDVLGLFLKSDGAFVFDEETKTLTSAQFTVDAGSVFTNLEARDTHLKGADFLNVAAHERITFVMTSARATGDRTGVVTGDLTLLGVTKPIDVTVTWNKSGASPFGGRYTIGLTAEAVVKRSDFGMTYGVEQGFIGDDIPVLISFEAVKQE